MRGNAPGENCKWKEYKTHYYAKFAVRKKVFCDAELKQPSLLHTKMIILG